MLIGGSGRNVLDGRLGNDTLNGFTGSDTLIGGFVSDTCVFSLATPGEIDRVNEASGQGTDTLSFASVTSAVTLNIGATGIQSVHANRSLVLSSTSGIEHVIGGSADDVIYGNDKANELRGNGGKDLLVGLDGNDTLSGGFGNDILVGGRGADSLNGNQGEDLLIAGYTLSEATEDSAAFLTQIRTIWFGADPFATRQAALTPVLVPATTVINDSEADVLASSLDLSLDWLFVGIADGVTKDAADVLSLF